VEVSTVGGTSLIEISYKHATPANAEEGLEYFLKAYQNKDREIYHQNLESTRKVLDESIAQLEKKLIRLGKDLAGYKKDGGGGDGRRNVSVVIQSVLIHRVQQSVHVAAALRVASVGQLLGRVNGNDNDGGQNGNDTDDEEQLDERKTSASGTSGHGASREGRAREQSRKHAWQCNTFVCIALAQAESNAFFCKAFLVSIEKGSRLAGAFCPNVCREN
jgi:hypothetical protein